MCWVNSARNSSGSRIWKFRRVPRASSSSLRIGEGPAGVLLGLVHHLPAGGHLDQSGQAEGTAGHVADQALDSGAVAGRQVHRLVDAETAVRPSPHVLDYFRLDLVLGQVQGEHGFLPSRLQPLQVQLRELQELALGRKRPAGQQNMHVRVPVQKFAECLDGGDHAGHHVVAAEQASDFGLEARPGAAAELAQQLAIETRMQPQAFGDGQHDLPVRDGSTDVFGHVDRGEQCPLLVAGGTRATLLAGKGDEHLMVAVRAADAGEAFVQVAALEEGLHAVLDDRAPEAVLGRKPLVVDLLEGVEVLVQQPPQIGGLRIAGTVQRQRLDTRGRHSSSWSDEATLRVRMREKAEVGLSSPYQ